MRLQGLRLSRLFGPSDKHHHRKLLLPNFLLVPVDNSLLNVDSFRHESPAFALIVLVAVQPTAGRPHTSDEGPFIDRTDPHVSGTSRLGTEGDAKPRTGAHELIRTGGNNQSVRGCGIRLENVIKMHVETVSIQLHSLLGMIMVKEKSGHFSLALVRENDRPKAQRHAIALSQFVVRVQLTRTVLIDEGINSERRKAQCFALAEGVKKVCSSSGKPAGFRYEQGIVGAAIAVTPFGKVGRIDIRRIDIKCGSRRLPNVDDLR